MSAGKDERVPLVVHVLSPRTCGDAALIACAGILRESVGFEHLAVVVGTSAESDRAERCGVRVWRKVHGEGPCAEWRRSRTLKRSLLARHHESGQSRRLILQAWCGVSADVVRRAAPPGSARSVMLLDVPQEAGFWDGFGPFDARIAVMENASADAIARLIVEQSHCMGAMERGRVRAHIRVLAPPDVRPTFIALDRIALRCALGVEEHERVAVLVSRDSGRGDGLGFAFAVGLSQVAGTPLVGVFATGTEGSRRAARFTRQHGRAWGMAQVDWTLAEMITASDVVIVQDSGSHGRGHEPNVIVRHLAAAAGVPIIQEGTPRTLVDALATMFEHPPPNRNQTPSQPRSGPGLPDLWREMLNLPITRPEFALSGTGGT